MSESAPPIISITTPNRSFKDHVSTVSAIAVFPDGRRMATSSHDETIRLWNLKDGVVLKKIEEHGCWVLGLAVSRNGQLIASGDSYGKPIVWHADTGKFLTPDSDTKIHSSSIYSLDFSPDGAVLATTKGNETTLWSTKTWQVHGNPISCGSEVKCVRYSPSGELAIATDWNIEIWNTRTSESIAILGVRYAYSIAWTPDGTRLLSGHYDDIREWDTSIWKQIGDPWTGHTSFIEALAVNSTGTLIASASKDQHVRLWRRSDRQTIAAFKHSDGCSCVAFSTDDKYIFSGGYDGEISEWAVPEDVQDIPEHTLQAAFRALYITNGDTALSSKDYDKAIELYSAAINLISASDAIVASHRTENTSDSEWAVQDSVLLDAPKDQSPEVSLFQRFRRRILPKHILPENSSEEHVTSNAIKLYSPAIDLDSSSDTIFASRCTAKLGEMLWEDALLDAQKVTEINPSSYLGYQLKNTAFRGAQRYDEAIISHDIMLSKLDNDPNTHTQEVRQQYVTSSEAASAIREVIHAQLEDTPHRLINTITGHLCDRAEQIIAFKTSPEYKELLSSTLNRGGSDLPKEDISNAMKIYFRFVMLSHRWEENEPLLRHIQDKDVYKLDPVGGIIKLQSFCKTARDTGYRWAWIDTCCIDQTNNVEVQQSVNSMFVWYRHSALTIVYLSDVPPSSKLGALARSVWNKRGWTVQEFLAPKIVLFYHSDWTLYLNDRSPNHKDSTSIMRELGDATGIDSLALVAFSPGMRGAREKLQWVSTRITTLQEDIAYSLFGIFGIHLPVIYGENKQNALGRLLQEIVAKSGDITSLDWVGKPSEFNSCLPASITSYGAPPSKPPSPLSEDEMQASVLSLRDAVDAELASRFYQRFESLNTPQFIASRLRLPCIAFTVAEVRRKRGKFGQLPCTFEVKAAGLRDLLIATDDKLIQFSRAKPIRQSFLLVHPWDRFLLDFHDFEEHSDTESIEDSSPPVSPSSPIGSVEEIGLVESESSSRELRLIARLGQPFSAFLLAQQRGGEYKRIASDQNIVAQVQDITTILDTMDVRTIEIV